MDYILLLVFFLLLLPAALLKWVEGPWPGKHIHTYSKIDPHSGIPVLKLHVVLTRDSLVNKGRKERNLKSQKANTEPLYTEVINTAYEDINCVLSFIWLDDGAQTPKSNGAPWRCRTRHILDKNWILSTFCPLPEFVQYMSRHCLKNVLVLLLFKYCLIFPTFVQSLSNLLTIDHQQVGGQFLDKIWNGIFFHLQPCHPESTKTGQTLDLNSWTKSRQT